LTTGAAFVSFRIIIADRLFSANAAERLKREHGMKHLIVAITLLSGSLWAQSSPALDIPTPASPANGPSYSQMYCSGFVTREAIPRTNFVLGSKEGPHEDRIPGRALMFLGGPGLAEGQRYSLLRQIEDPDREDSSPEQRKKLAKLGALYQEVGWVTVHMVQKGSAVASFDFSCDAAIRGDIVVPYREKPALAFRTTDPPISSFHPAVDRVSGHILGSQEYLALLGAGMAVYTDFGAAKGAKPGDYLVILRGYAPGDLNRIDRASEQLPRGAATEANAVKPPKIHPNADNRIPPHVLGELLVLNVSREASTAVITRAFAELELGDAVQSEDGPSAHAETPQSARTETAPCQPASHLRRMLFLAHGCKAAK
jgi:hypothetical protein